jgi:hypothetical protein
LEKITLSAKRSVTGSDGINVDELFPGHYNPVLSARRSHNFTAIESISTINPNGFSWLT